MDEEFEEVVDLVGEEVESAGLGLGRGEGEGKWLAGLVAGCEGDVLEVTEAVCDLCPTKCQSTGDEVDQVQRLLGRKGGSGAARARSGILHVPRCH